MKNPPAPPPSLLHRLELMVGHAPPTVAAAQPTGFSRVEHQHLVARLARLLDDAMPAPPIRHRRS